MITEDRIMVTSRMHGSPFIFLGRCVISIDVALSFGEKQTVQYTKNPITREWKSVLGEKNRYCFYPAGVGETV